MKPQSANSPLLSRWLRPLLVGLCVGVIAGTLLLLVAALVLKSVSLPASTIRPMAVTAAGVGAFAAGLAAAITAKERGLLTGAVCGALLYLLLLLIGLVRLGGADTGYAFIKWAVLTVCGAVGGLVGVNRKRH